MHIPSQLTTELIVESKTWYVPEFVTKLWIWGFGGGGGGGGAGGGSGTTAGQGGSGGNGAFPMLVVQDVDPNDAIVIACGAGGSAGTGGSGAANGVDGGAGGDTTISGTYRGSAWSYTFKGALGGIKGSNASSHSGVDPVATAREWLPYGARTKGGNGTDIIATSGPAVAGGDGDRTLYAAGGVSPTSQTSLVRLGGGSGGGGGAGYGAGGAGGEGRADNGGNGNAGVAGGYGAGGGGGAGPSQSGGGSPVGGDGGAGGGGGILLGFMN